MSGSGGVAKTDGGGRRGRTNAIDIHAVTEGPAPQ